MSRAPGAGGLRAKKGPAAKEEKKDKLAEFVKKRDYTGALAILEFNRKSGDASSDLMTLMWMGYCAFHLGQFQRAFDAYQVTDQKNFGQLSPSCSPFSFVGFSLCCPVAFSPQDALTHFPECPAEAHLYQAACLFYLQMYKPCEEAAAAYGEAESRALSRAVAEATTDDALQDRRARDRAAATSGSLLGGARGRPNAPDSELRATITKEVTDAHAARRAPEAALRTRLLFHLAHRTDDQVARPVPRCALLRARSLPPSFALFSLLCLLWDTRAERAANRAPRRHPL